ncbi:MAG: hypothetical protein V4623_08400 [Pseudomonadota bacterium]
MRLEMRLRHRIEGMPPCFVLAVACIASLLAHFCLLLYLELFAPGRVRSPRQALPVSVTLSARAAQGERIPHASPPPVHVKSTLLVPTVSALPGALSEPAPAQEMSVVIPQFFAVEYYPLDQLSSRPELIDSVDLSMPFPQEPPGEKRVLAALFINELGIVDRMEMLPNDLHPESIEQLKTIFLNARFQPGEIAGVWVKSQMLIEINIGAMTDSTLERGFM